ncbi:pseudouridine synthase [Persephonella sp.]
MKKFSVDQSTDLKSFLSEILGITKNKAKEIIDSKIVFVNSKRVWIASHPLKKGDTVEISGFYSRNSWKLTESVIYEDSYIIAVQKPPFLESEGNKNSVEFLLKKEIDKRIRAIHRLDRETSGVLLFARNDKVFYRFKDIWRKKEVTKLYLSISYGEAGFRKKVVNLPVDKKYAKSIFRTKKVSSGLTLFEVEIKTGRKHQIRIHSSKIRHPIVGDKIYGLKHIEDPLLKNVSRQMLHGYRIRFRHPFTGKVIDIKAPPYQDFFNFGKLVKLL